MKLELLPLDKTAVFARLDSGELITYALCDVFRPGASKEEFAANARRIVACFNACAGIPTDMLEAMPSGPASLLPPRRRTEEGRGRRQGEITMRSREEEGFERHAGYPPDDPPKEPDPA